MSLCASEMKCVHEYGFRHLLIIVTKTDRHNIKMVAILYHPLLTNTV